MKIITTDSRPILHIGMTKTGSSFIQQRIFSKVDNTKYLHDEANLLIDALSKGLRKPEDKSFKQLQLGKIPKVIISHERLHGQHPGLLRNMVYRLFGTYFVSLLVVRSPSTWIESFYRQRIRRGEFNTRSDWFESNSSSLLKQLNIDKIYNGFNHDPLQTQLEILPYEMLENEPDRFHKELKRICGIDYKTSDLDTTWINRSLPYEFLESVRSFNSLIEMKSEKSPELEVLTNNLRDDFYRLAESDKEYLDFISRTIDRKNLLNNIKYPNKIYNNFDCLKSFSWYKDYGKFYRFDNL